MTESSGSQGGPRAGQEAARLVAAAQDWLRSSAPHLAPVDADGTTCACPVCRAVAGAREADPDAVGRWVDAAVAAATSVLSQAGERLAPTPDDAGSDSGTDDVWTADVDDPAVTHGDLEGDGGTDDNPVAPAPRDASARQDDGCTRGVRRIPLEQTEPGDLDG